MYVPILKEKAGEKEALLNLKDQTMKSIRPLFEIPPEHLENSNLESLSELCGDYLFYLDFPSEEVSEGIADKDFDKWFDFQQASNFIPVIRLSYDSKRIDRVSKSSTNGVAIRITLNEFFEEDFDTDLSSALSQLSLEDLDLIVDVQAITKDDYKQKSAAVITSLNNLQTLEKFREVIVSSGNFPATLDVEKEKLVLLARHELDLFESIQRNFDRSLVYSDYAIGHWTTFEYILGMKPSFNIRYTLEDRYLVYKGKTIKSGGLDYDNVRDSSEALVSSPYFKGPSFSWADNIIQGINDGTIKKGGNSTKWRAYGTNHHIEFIVRQISNSL